MNWISTVYHALPKDLLPFNVRPEPGYLAFLGRISPEKAPTGRLNRGANRAASQIDVGDDRTIFAVGTIKQLDSLLGRQAITISNPPLARQTGRAMRILFATPDVSDFVQVGGLAAVSRSRG